VIRSRERRRNKSERAPGILRDAAIASAESPMVQHGERGFQINWRIFSGLMVAVMLVVLVIFFITDAFYVHSISVAGLRYLGKEEVYRWANIANSHLFWVNEASVRAAIMESPAVADAEVSVGFPPDMIRITVTEREPALIWDQANVPVWLDVSGRVLMIPPEEREDLLRVVVENVDEPVTPQTRIEPEVVTGALLLRELLPGTNTLRYHPVYGLGFQDTGGWDAWFGSGLDMPIKILVYKEIVESQQGNPLLREINVVNPDAPFLCCDQ
jgi:cell division septal protein FtsQ